MSRQTSSDSVAVNLGCWLSFAIALLMAGCGQADSSSSGASAPTDNTSESAITSPSAGPAATTGFADLAWSANSEPDLSGYRVYYGVSSGTYDQEAGQGINAGNATSYVVTGLAPGQRYYFAVTAYDTSGNESGYSNQVSKVIP